MVCPEAAAMLCCSSILGILIWEQLMTIHCILTGVCLRNAHKEALKQRQRKNPQFMSLTLVFWGAPWLSDFASHNPVHEPLVPKLWGVFRAMHHVDMTDMWGEGNDHLTSTCRELQRRVGSIKVPNTMTQVQGGSASLAAHRLGMCGKPHCGVLALGSVPSAGLMLCTQRGKKSLLWAHAALPWDALHQLSQQQH